MTVAITLILLLVGGLSVLMYLAFRRPPVNPPKKFRTRGPRPGAHTVTVTFGDSLTHASLSADWVGALRERLGPGGHEFVNAGINGHTTADLLGRLEEVVACQPDAVTILIGTNDARNGIPVTRFQTNLEQIVDQLQAHTTARIALLSAPPLGEDLDGPANRELAPYNAAIKQTATCAGITYLPAYERIAEHIRSNGTAPRFAFSFGLALRVALQHYLLRRSLNDIATGNGLTMLTDHIHLSDQAGTLIADLVTGWLSRTPAR
ncbi:SGNH/GDSL hydrolase family protein [Streptosporangium sp. NPDC000396]|uniref:SGNH/GDSL hydrolase family protein n=1 Tax=Streptosporangium sp. NPDC000396 TaxID=3366185 RepID=UPI0036B89DCC